MYRVAGISFEHMHMLDNLQMAADHPLCDVVAICDSQPERLREAQTQLGLDDSAIYHQWESCLEHARPDFIVLCPATGQHCTWVERLAPFGIPLLVEKPMAASLDEADRMLEVCRRHDVVMAINWPLVWVPSHRTAWRLIQEGRIGQLTEVHYYNGNRGPLWHTANKRQLTEAEVAAAKPTSWFYSREQGGGSMLDYLGYGATLGTWFLGGRKPLAITSVVDRPKDLEVDEHSITIARYEFGLSKFETRWGTYTDPWTHQPQPGCGFVLVGTEGTLSSFDYQPTVKLQDREHPGGIDIPVDAIDPPHQNPIQYFVDCLLHARPIEGPLSPEMSRVGQQIVDTAFHSAQQQRTLPLMH